MPRLASALVLVLLLGSAPGAGAQQQGGVQVVGEYGRSPAHAVAVTGTVAYLGGATRLTILNVADPTRPTELGRTTLSGQAEYVLSAGQYVFAVAGEVVDVVDVADPAAPTVVATFRPGAGDAAAVALAGQYAYVAAGDGGLRVVDVSDPRRPTEVGALPFTPRGQMFAVGLAVSGRYVYVAAGVGLVVVDVADPTRPVSVGFASIQGIDVALSGSTAYVGASNGLRVVDVSDPTRPRETAASAIPTGRLRLSGTTLYAASFAESGGLRVVDVGGATPVEVAHYPTPATRGVDAAGGHVYLADAERGLLVFNYPAAPPRPYQLRAWLPVVLQNATWTAAPGAFTSSILLQNPSSSEASVVVDFIRLFGGPSGVSHGLRIGAGQTALIYLPSLTGLAPGQYSAAVASDQPVRAVVNVASDAPPAAASYSGVRGEDVARTVFVPGVFRNYLDLYTTTITVQNTDSVNATRVTLTYRDQDGRALPSAEQLVLPPTGSASVSLAGATVLGNGFVGSAVVESEQPVAVAAHTSNPAGELTGVTGVSAGAPMLSLPVAYKNYSADAWISSVLLQNLDDVPLNVTLTFLPLDGSLGFHHNDTLPAGAARQYYQGGVPAGLPDGFVGNVFVMASGGGRIASVVNTRNAAGNLSAYNGFRLSQGGGTLHYPSLYDTYSPRRWASSMLIHRLGLGTAATIEYFDRNGPVRTLTETTSGFQHTTLRYQPGEAEGLPEGFAGGARVTNPEGPLVGVANNLAMGQGRGDWLLTYEAFAEEP